MPDLKTVTLQRTREQWEKCDPEAMCNMSQAAIFHALTDAKRDVIALHDALAAKVGKDELNSLAGQLNASNERNGRLRQALQACSAELFAQCGDQPRAMVYVNEARALLAAPTPAAQSAGQAVYQTQRIMGGWDDVNPQEFDRTHESRRRVVYAAPVNDGEREPGSFAALGARVFNQRETTEQKDDANAFKRIARYHTERAADAQQVNGGEREELRAKVGGDEREAFERWFEADAMPSEADWFKREKDEPEEYAQLSTHAAWAAWQARAALSADGVEDKRGAKCWRVLLANDWSLTSIECDVEPFRMWAIIGIAFSTGWHSTPQAALDAAIADNQARKEE